MGAVVRMNRNGSGSKRWTSHINCLLADAALRKVSDATSTAPRLAVFYGRAGLGKSIAMQATAAAHNAVYIAARSIHTRKTFLSALCRELEVDQRGTLPDLFDKACAELALARRALIIDEMDHLVRANAVEMIRDLHEELCIPILMVGEESLPKKLLKWERFHSRVLVWQQAQPTSIDDAKNLANFYCQDLDIAPDLLKAIVSATHGNTRRITVNLEAVRAVCVESGMKGLDLAGWNASGNAFFTGESAYGIARGGDRG